MNFLSSIYGSHNEEVWSLGQEENVTFLVAMLTNSIRNDHWIPS